MNDEIQQLLDQITDYCRKAEISESTFGRLVVNDGKFVSRLRSGRGVTLKTLTRTREYMRAHPPGPDSISESDASLKLVDTTVRPPAVSKEKVETEPPQGPSVAFDIEKGIGKNKTRRPFRFYENRQKYLHFVHTCNEKWAISQRAGRELKLLHPRFPALRMFDAGMGDGTVLAYLLQHMHRLFPTVPFFINAKEMSLEDVRLGLGKLPDRFVEHPATVFVISNMAYAEAPWLDPHSSSEPLNWHEIALEGNCAHEYGEQIESLQDLLDEGWQTRPSPKTGNPLYARPSVLVIYRADQKFMMQGIIPEKGRIAADYDFVLAAQPWQARVSAEFKVKRILAPLTRSLAQGGRLLGVQSYGDDPGLEIIRSIWPDENPFTINRHVLINVLKEELGPEAREFHFNAMSDARSVFRYDMHILPSEIGDHIGSSTLFAAWNAAIYVNQIEDDQLEDAVSSGQYLQATREILKKRGGLWFNDETFVITRKNIRGSD